MTFSVDSYLNNLPKALDAQINDVLEEMGISADNLELLGTPGLRSDMWRMMDVDSLLPETSAQKKAVSAHLQTHTEMKTLKAFVKQQFEQIALDKAKCESSVAPSLNIAHSIAIPDTLSVAAQDTYKQIIQLLELNLNSILPQLSEEESEFDEVLDNIWFDEISEQVEGLLQDEAPEIQQELDAFADAQNAGDEFISDHVYELYQDMCDSLG